MPPVKRKFLLSSVVFLLSLGLGIVLLGCGYSGGFPSLSPKGYIVKPSHLSQYTSGGSLSTLWYRGSDSNFHYFSHLVKVSTNYRVRRSDLLLSNEDEFEIGSKKDKLVAYFRNPTLTDAINKSRQKSNTE